MSSNDLTAMAFLGPILFGIAIATAIRVLPRGAAPEANDVLREALDLLSWILIAVGIVGSTIPITGGMLALVLDPPAAVVVVIVLLMSLQRNRLANHYALLWALTTAAEQNIPLASAAEAFAEDHRAFGRRARKLARSLKSGWPLPDALELVRGPLPREDLVMIRVAYQAGALSQGLRETVLAARSRQALWGDAAAKIAYLLVIPTYAMGVLVFMGLKIAPALIRILRDFDLDLPGPTALVFDASEAVAQYWFLGMPLYAIVCYLLVHAVLRYIGVMVDVDLPGMGFVKRRYHAAVILDIFALATQHGRPIREAIGILASRYPCWSIRSKLGCVWRDADQGMDWVESLFQRGVVGEAEHGVLQAAQRVGNLPWALREMAASVRRRLAHRIQAALHVVFPLVILAYGAVAGAFVVGYFMPLVALIRKVC